jgi:molybdopterin converting factor subunit 1
MKLAVRLFARARDLAGAEQVFLELPAGSRVADVRGELARQVPELASLAASLLVAVDNDYAADETQLSGNSEVACFPPVSGG